MSSATPDRVLYDIWNNAHGRGAGPIVTLKEWREYYRDQDGWFTYYGDAVDMRLNKVGGGIYRIEGGLRYV